MADNDSTCQGAGVLMFPCSGGSDVGELSDKVARKIAQDGQARMFCLAGIGANIPGIVQTAKAAKKIVAIDGCRILCSKKILENAGLNPVSYNLEEMGFEKGKTAVDEAAVEKAAREI